MSVATEVLEIIRYLDVQIIAVEQEIKDYDKQFDEEPTKPNQELKNVMRWLEDATIKKETLVQVKDWIFDNFTKRDRK